MKYFQNPKNDEIEKSISLRNPEYKKSGKKSKKRKKIKNEIKLMRFGCLQNNSFLV